MDYGLVPADTLWRCPSHNAPNVQRPRKTKMFPKLLASRDSDRVFHAPDSVTLLRITNSMQCEQNVIFFNTYE